MPANLNKALWSLYDAITLRIFLDWIEGLWNDFRGVEKAAQTTNEELRKVGIYSDSIFWSFGPYAKLLAGLVVIYAFYLVIKMLVHRFGWLQWLVKFLKQKLFYSSVIRFMI